MTSSSRVGSRGRLISVHVSTPRILLGWVEEIGSDTVEYGTHSMRRSKASLIHKKTKNLRAVHILLGHSKLESTVRYLGIEVDDALEQDLAHGVSGSHRDLREYTVGGMK